MGKYASQCLAAWESQEESYCIFVNRLFAKKKKKEYLQTDQGVRKVTNWKKALEGTCKYENVSDSGANLDVKGLELEEWIHISRLVGWTDAATSGNGTDLMGKHFLID